MQTCENGGTTTVAKGRTITISTPAGTMVAGDESDLLIALSDVDRLDLGAGDDVLIARAAMGTILGRGGDDLLQTTAPVEEIRLGRGDDSLDAEGRVERVVAGAGDDNVILGEGAALVALGAGADPLRAAGEFGSLHAGAGDDRVTLEGRAKGIRLGAGDDLLFVSGHAETVRGGAGHDTLVIDGRIAAFDCAVRGLGPSGEVEVALTRRATGESLDIRGIEQFVFDDAAFGQEAMASAFAGDTPAIMVADGTQAVTVNNPDPTEVVIWNRAALEAVIDIGTVGPTVASRAYALVNTAMYDAWASYSETAVRVSFDADGDTAALEAGAVATEANKAAAVSYAAHAVLSQLFPGQVEIFDTTLVTRLGLTLGGDGSVAWQIGVDAAEDLMALRLEDGSNQLGGYLDTTGYQPVNPHPLAINDITRWTPENMPVDPEDTSPEQRFATPQWGQVESFALPEDAQGAPVFDAIRPDAPEPFFSAAYAGSEIDFTARTITLSAPLELDGVEHAAGSPVAVSKALIGSVINAGFIDQALDLIDRSANLTDADKLKAEFFEDGPGTAFPPGTWISFAEFVSARDAYTLDDDAAMFFMVGNAVMDAGIATWEAKVHHDYARPVRAIRDLGALGLIGEPGVDELTGEAGNVIEAWGGIDPLTGMDRGTRTILPQHFLPYQRFGGHPSPPFAEHTSGHSAFSRAAAEVLALYTGSDDFGGGVVFAPGSSQFSPGAPASEIAFFWQTFTEAAEAAGDSRLAGQIHFAAGNEDGQALGAEIGALVYEQAQSFIDGTATDADRPFYTQELLG